MKLAAIYNVWDGEELLKFSLKNISPLVDGVIIVWSKFSNHGEEGTFNPNDYTELCINHEPEKGQAPHYNERMKRNKGLETAKGLGYTHFLMLDCDEFYNPDEFLKEKERIEREDLAGTVCKVQVYFGNPELTIGLDPVTYVPFIHKITPRLKYSAMNKTYPFAVDSGGARIDPTRRLNIEKGVKRSDITMHHYSWVRKDIQKKVRNSSANLSRSSCLEDYANARAGYRVKMYDRVLHKVPNYFNIQL